jgi:hypothetical protein
MVPMSAAAGSPITSQIVRVDTVLKGLSVTTEPGAGTPPWGARLQIERGQSHSLVGVKENTATLQVSESLRCPPVLALDITIVATITFAAELPEGFVRDPQSTAMLASVCRPYHWDLIALITGRMGFPPLLPMAE